MQAQPTILPLGDAALVVQFENGIDAAVHHRVMQLFHQLQGAPAFIKDVVPAYGSLTIHYDVAALYESRKPAFEKLVAFLQPLLQNSTYTKPLDQRNIHIPVCFAEQFGPDLQELAAQKELSVDEVIQLYTATAYEVYMIGFLPGFAYMGKVDSRIAMPRKSSPRKTINAGSVGIAGEQTGIYPFPSPGGWNIIGRTPLSLFSKSEQNPVLLQPGDRVTFYAITEDVFENYQGRTA
ncbi:MAG TPA: 5-oxoprolinase subunit PxpB [Flavisolibacter sp.]|jgi:inhibitor of KinA|nr:5-oxoprolinase subunit PxpB [Flavisolibacter sp.]